MAAEAPRPIDAQRATDRVAPPSGASLDTTSPISLPTVPKDTTPSLLSRRTGRTSRALLASAAAGLTLAACSSPADAGKDTRPSVIVTTPGASASTDATDLSNHPRHVERTFTVHGKEVTVYQEDGMQTKGTALDPDKIQTAFETIADVCADSPTVKLGLQAPGTPVLEIPVELNEEKDMDDPTSIHQIDTLADTATVRAFLSKTSGGKLSAPAGTIESDNPPFEVSVVAPQTTGSPFPSDVDFTIAGVATEVGNNVCEARAVDAGNLDAASAKILAGVVNEATTNSLGLMYAVKAGGGDYDRYLQIATTTDVPPQILQGFKSKYPVLPKTAFDKL